MTESPEENSTDIEPKDVHIEFKDVSKSFDQKHQIIQNLNLAIHRGEFLTMLGPSGSGKTTCLMMLAGFETPTSGAITVNGNPIQQLMPHRRNIGMVFQHYALFPHMNVGKNLAFPLEVRRIPKTERTEKIEKALELVQLEGYQDRMPTQLSGGQQQRVAIARALVFEPDIVLMDEPLGALDRRLREEMQFEIRRLHKQLGVTMVYVTHDQQEAMVLSDQVAVLQNGKIEQIAPPETLYEEPNRVFVSSFIGDNNLLFGVVKKVEDNEICHVDLNGEDRVQAFTVSPHQPGDEVWVSVRPERVKLSPKKDMYVNEFEAIVDDMAFMGDHLRLNLTTCGIKRFNVKIQNVVGHGRVLPGDTVRIGWAALDCRALAKEKNL